MSNMNYLSENLKAIRLSKNMTQDELSKRANVSRGYVNQIEAKKKTNVTVSNMEKLFFALDIRITFNFINL